MKIEFDPALTKEEKTPHMVEWWSTAHGKMTEVGFHNSNLKLKIFFNF